MMKRMTAFSAECLRPLLGSSVGDEAIRAVLRDLLRDFARGEGYGGLGLRALWGAMVRLRPELAGLARLDLADILAAGGVEFQTPRCRREIPALLRLALRSSGADSWPLRLLLAEFLILNGRGGQARRFLAAAWRRPPRAATQERFRALILLRRYPEAFQEGERLIRPPLSLQAVGGLSWPWGIVSPEIGGAKEYLGKDLDILDKSASGRGGVWAIFYRAALARRLGHGQTEANSFEDVDRFSISRYGWMRYELGRDRMFRQNLPGAIRALRIACKASRPIDWKWVALLGEAYVRSGRSEKGFAVLRRAREAAGSERGEALAEEAQMLLWLGRYRPALRILDEAVSLGSRAAFCWRAMAAVKLGRPKEALLDLDRALRLKYREMEVRVWRGEARRLLGDRRGALRELNAVVKLSPDFWAYAHRALVFASLGRPERMMADFHRAAKMAEARVAQAQARLGLRADRGLSRTQVRVVLADLVRNRNCHRLQDPPRIARRQGRLTAGQAP